MTFGTANNLAGATMAAFDLPTAQDLFNTRGQYDTINVLAKPGADNVSLQHAIARVLPPGVEVVTGQTVANEQTNNVNHALSFFSTALLVFAFISLFVGGFTIFNTFSIMVGQRTRELALLRIVGASRRQVFRSVLVEAGIVGLVASLIGLGLGVLAAVGLEALLKGFGITLPSAPLVFESRTVIVALVVGVGVTMISAISPARRAVRIAPVAALVASPRGAGGVLRRRVTVGGLRRRRHRRAGGGPDLAGHPAGRRGRGGRLRRHRHAGPDGGPAAGERARAPPGRHARHLGPARAGELDAQPAPDRPDVVRADGGPGPGVDHRRVRRLAVQSATDQRRQRHQRRLHHHRPGPGSAARCRRPSPGAGGHRGLDRLQRTVRGPAFGHQPDRCVHGQTAADGQTADGLRERRPALAAGKLLIDTTTANTKHLTVGSVVPVKFAQTGATTMSIGGIFKPNALLGSYLVGDGFFLSHFDNPLPIAVLSAPAGRPSPKRVDNSARVPTSRSRPEPSSRSRRRPRSTSCSG